MAYKSAVSAALDLVLVEEPDQGCACGPLDLAGLTSIVGYPLRRAQIAVFEDFAPVDQYAVQCDLAAAVFRNETMQEFPIEDAIANMRVIDALYRSAASGRWEIP